jgi:hypothetical protein
LATSDVPGYRLIAAALENAGRFSEEKLVDWLQSHWCGLENAGRFSEEKLVD